jgi:hypothetical protein
MGNKLFTWMYWPLHPKTWKMNAPFRIEPPGFSVAGADGESTPERLHTTVCYTRVSCLHECASAERIECSVYAGPAQRLDQGGSPGLVCHFALSSTVIDCRSSGVCVVTLLSLLSLSVQMTDSPWATRWWGSWAWRRLTRAWRGRCELFSYQTTDMHY